MVVGFDDWKNALSTCARPTSEDDTHLLFLNEILRLLCKLRPVGCAICNNPFNRPTQQTACSIDLFESKNFSVNHCLFADCHWTSLRMQNANDDRASIHKDSVKHEPRNPSKSDRAYQDKQSAQISFCCARTFSRFDNSRIELRCFLRCGHEIESISTRMNYKTNL